MPSDLDQKPSIESLFHMGFLPFPKESEEEYRKRAENLIQRHDRFRNFIRNTSTNNSGDVLVENYHLEGPLSYFHAFWKIRPTWPVTLFSKLGMSFFHLGGLCCQEFENEPIYFVQIHSRMQRTDKFLGYQRDLIIAHEMIHLLREGLDMGTFEEFIAYDTDPYFFRRAFGPFFSMPWMPALFMLQIQCILLVIFVCLGFFPGFEELIPAYLNPIFTGIGALSLLPWFRFGYLSYSWHRFQNKIKSSPWSSKRRSFALGLHEKDIWMLSKLNIEEWKNYLETLPKDLYKQRLLQTLF